MTESTLNTLIGSTTTTVALLIGLVATWMNLRGHQDKVAAKVEANTVTTEATAVKADKIIDKTTKIETATNGTLHEMAAHVKVQAERMLRLERQIAMLLEDKKAMADLAAAKSKAEADKQRDRPKAK